MGETTGVLEAKHKVVWEWKDVSKKPKLLFLDDRSKRLHAALRKYGDDYDVTLVATAKECIKMLSNEGPWDVVSLDHDLCFEEFVNSDREDCGMEVVRWLLLHKNHFFLAQYFQTLGSPPKKFIIHTSNRAAAMLMEDELREFVGTTGIQIVIERFTYDD